MIREEYLNMQEHLLYITELIVKDLHSLNKIRGVMAVWDASENTAKITFYYNGEVTEDELEDFSIVNSEIIAHCSNAKLKENFIRLDYPQSLPKSLFWAYLKNH